MIRYRVGVGLVAGLLVACTEPVPDPEATAVELLTPSADSVVVGSVKAVRARAIDGARKELTSKVLTWSTSNPAIATVDGSGNVSGVAKGDAQITATVDKKSIQMTMRVISAVQSVAIFPTSFDLALNEARQLAVTVQGPGGEALAGREVTFSTSNQTIASVTSAGVVVAVAVGNATITATSGGKTAQTVVRVVPERVAAVQITPAANQTIRVGSTLQFTARALNAQNQVLARTINWTSSNSSIASVSASGLVTGVAAGAVSIAAEADDKIGQVLVQVTLTPIGSVAVSPATSTMFVNDLKQLTLEARDTAGRVVNLNQRNPIWTSTDLTIATVSREGVVLANAAGTARIRCQIDEVTSNDVTITVRNVPIASIEIQPAVLAVKLGQPQQMFAVARDSLGRALNNRVITWSSNPTGIVNVNAAGQVTGIALGQTTVFATAEGITGNAQVTVVP